MEKSQREINIEQAIKRKKKMTMIKYIAVFCLIISIALMLFSATQRGMEKIAQKDLIKENLSIELTEKGYRLLAHVSSNRSMKQIEMFGNYSANLNITMCNTTNIYELCNSLSVYPTWLTPDGSEFSGVFSFQELRMIIDACDYGDCLRPRGS